MIARQRLSPVHVIYKLRERGFELDKDTTVTQVFRQLNITDKTCFRWRCQYGGLKVEQAKQIWMIEQENGPPKHIVADQAFGADEP